jgi:hypothetical protein
MNCKTIAMMAVMTLGTAAFAADQNPSAADQMNQPQMNNPNAAAPGAAAPNSNQAQSMPTRETAKNSSDLSPKDVCKRIVELEKGTTPATPQQLDQFVYNAQKMHEMQQKRGTASSGKGGTWFQKEIGKSDCSKETIAGNHAFVVAKSGEQQRLIPFVKDGNVWKLDAAAYRVLYRMEARMPASEGEKQSK